MRDLDETDLEILRLLVADARRPYSDIAEAVGLSPPAVSDRVDRLREEGIIRGFTADVDRSALAAGAPVLVTLSVRPEALETVVDTLARVDPVEHVFATASARVVAHARLPGGDVIGFLRETVDLDAVREHDVSLLADVIWTPGIGAEGFEIDCDECGNTVTSEGVTTRIDGSVYHFCCPSCRSNFEARYERFEEAA